MYVAKPAKAAIDVDCVSVSGMSVSTQATVDTSSMVFKPKKKPTRQIKPKERICPVCEFITDKPWYNFCQNRRCNAWLD